MKNIARGLVTLALAAMLVEKGHGQTTPPVSGVAAVSGTPPAVAAGPYAWPSPTISNPYPTVSLPHCGAPPACAAHEDHNGHLLKGDPLLDWSIFGEGAGWFGAVEVDAVGPAVKNRLNAPVTVGGLATTVQLPAADLSWTAMPHVELGYRLGQAAGELLMSYRGLNAAGSETLLAFDAAGNAAPLRSRLSVNVIDLDYASRENALGPFWDMKWRTGARVATLFFDSSAANAILAQHESNHFVGAGPHFALELKRRLADSGCSLIGEIDGGVVLGRVRQHYEEALAGVGAGTTFASANEPAPVLLVRFGLEYAPQALPNVHLSTGYLFERWWAVGETTGTQGEVTYQGIFLRGEWRY